MPYDIRVNKNFKDSVRRAELSLVRYAARVAVGEVSRLMRDSPATGRWYLSGKHDGSWHQASAPGEPPAVDTGGLVKSIAATVEETPTGAVSVVGSTLSDARWRWLEYGTSRIAPRPSARPAFYVAWAKLLEQMKAGAGKGMTVTGTVGPDVSGQEG